MTGLAALAGAVTRDLERFQRGVSAVSALHRPEGGKCRECRKPWPCPTDTALAGALGQDGGDGKETAS